ncbi:DUF465 domain-containing protein [Pacificitalea manganoxidans]|uniref:DUF465 domain-containing protein n=1 Tax=Pacificitalea manganoxidans TaxID=1411902 RepID=A0A291LV61_9RHOB|nr:YdcH family protein [Pacificitalea manganoxidans]ATI40590.1 DUF465 domain-containing protein [Pacificitalea manganoxidans]MBF52401.1 DUF465 domain-containing protein [Actibacterium sp.]MDR6309575.1 hypothetical protein [Pacificitalea manganoxidans]|tara:strand:- start:1197 stop:1364 length:168 start_codon:yes stop_codon:yes gene_type:complete
MTVSAHIQQLRRKHQSLAAEVEAAQRSPSADPLTIADMKKQKLKIKEEISRLSMA